MQRAWPSGNVSNAFGTLIPPSRDSGPACPDMDGLHTGDVLFKPSGDHVVMAHGDSLINCSFEHE